MCWEGLYLVRVDHWSAQNIWGVATGQHRIFGEHPEGNQTQAAHLPFKSKSF